MDGPRVAASSGNGASHDGIVKRLLRKDGYGFIRGEDGQDYYFNMHSLDRVPWEDLQESAAVTFRVLREPTREGKAGAAQQVRLHGA